MTGILLSDQREVWLAENPIGVQEPSTRCLWWPPGRAVGPMLARRIAAWDPTVEPMLRGRPSGLSVHVPVALGCRGQSFLAPDREPAAETSRMRLRDVERRQLMAVRRQERAAEKDLQELQARLGDFAIREKQVVGELRLHGYLQA